MFGIGLVCGDELRVFGDLLRKPSAAGSPHPDLVRDLLGYSRLNRFLVVRISCILAVLALTVLPVWGQESSAPENSERRDADRASRETLAAEQSQRDQARPSPIFDGNRLILPAPGTAPAGFTLLAVHGELARFGSIPLRVIIRPTGPTFRQDRELSLRINCPPGLALPTSRAANFETTVVLNANDTVVDQVFYLPKWFLGGSLYLNVWEAGQPLPGYGGESGRSQGPAFTPYDVGAPQDAWLESAQGRFAWIADPDASSLRRARSANDVEDLRLLMGSLAPELLGLPIMATEDSRLTVLREFGDLMRLSYFTIPELPTDWQGFEHGHVWITRWSTLLALDELAPEAAAALRQYLLCGGTLWVLEAPSPDEVAAHWGTWVRPEEPDDPAEGDEAEGLTEEAEAARIARSIDAEIEVANAGPDGLPIDPETGEIRFPLPSFRPPTARGGSGIYFDGPLRPRRALAEQLARTAFGEPFNDLQSVQDWVESFEGGLVEADIAAIPVGFGRVISCSRPGSLPGSFSQWQAMQMATSVGSSSVLRDGVDPIAGDIRFWNWTIPGVAQPPIYSFLALLSLFAILVGPVAYRKLNRMGRAYLMFLVAPLLAILTTVALFTYGVLADGLGTQVRVREVTWLGADPRDAARYARATYFAGLRPTDGLRFPANARVSPYPVSSFRDWRSMFGSENAAIGTIQLTDDELVLRGGFFPSRQQRQFVTHRPLAFATGVTWEGPPPANVAQGESPDSSADSSTEAPPRGPGRLRNGLDIPLRELILRDRAGDYWTVEEVAVGATVMASPLDLEAARRQLGELYTRQLPIPPIPIGNTRGTRLDLVAMLGSTFPYRQSLSTARAGGYEGEAEWWLRSNLQTSSRLPLGSFIALSDISPDCLAVRKARQVDSIHYVIGELR